MSIENKSKIETVRKITSNNYTDDHMEQHRQLLRTKITPTKQVEAFLDGLGTERKIGFAWKVIFDTMFGDQQEMVKAESSNGQETPLEYADGDYTYWATAYMEALLSNTSVWNTSKDGKAQSPTAWNYKAITNATAKINDLKSKFIDTDVNAETGEIVTREDHDAIDNDNDIQNWEARRRNALGFNEICVASDLSLLALFQEYTSTSFVHWKERLALQDLAREKAKQDAELAQKANSTYQQYFTKMKEIEIVPEKKRTEAQIEELKFAREMVKALSA